LFDNDQKALESRSINPANQKLPNTVYWANATVRAASTTVRDGSTLHSVSLRSQSERLDPSTGSPVPASQVQAGQAGLSPEGDDVANR